MWQRGKVLDEHRFTISFSNRTSQKAHFCHLQILHLKTRKIIVPSNVSARKRNTLTLCETLSAATIHFLINNLITHF